MTGIAALQVGRPFPRGMVREAADRLRRHILRGGAGKDGVLPSEPELTRMMGVSRTVLREALRRLEAQGLVEVSHGRRSRVKPADSQAAVESLEALLLRTPGAMGHLVEVREPLETAIAEFAAKRITDGDLDALEKSIDDQRRARTLAGRVEADARFHRILAESTGNPVFIMLMETMAALLRESRLRTIGKHGVEGAVRCHLEILRALRSKSPEAAREAMARHFRITRRELVGRAK